MDTFLNEDEQVDKIKKWLKEYGPTIIVSILVVIVVTFGWRYWNQKQSNEKAQASNYYEQLISSAMSQNSSAVVSQAKTLMKNFSSTPYAALGALLLAKQYIVEGKMQEAQAQFQWVMEKSEDDSLQQIARNRLAKLMIAQNKPKAALALLNTVNDKGYQAAVLALKGDAYAKLNDIQQARDVYQKALDTLPKKSDARALLQMKLHNLPA